MALENVLGLADSYLTLADNFYIYSDPVSGRMIYFPADFDGSLGTTTFDPKLMLSGNYSEHPGFTLRPLTRHLYANDIMLGNYQTTLLNLSQNLINPNVINPFIDNVVNMIADDVAWDKTLPRLGKYIDLSSGGVGAFNVADPAIRQYIPDGFSISSNFTNNATETSADSNSPVDEVKAFLYQKSANIISFYNVTSN